MRDIGASYKADGYSFAITQKIRVAAHLTWFKLTSSQESMFKLPNSEGKVPWIRLFFKCTICSIGKLASDQGNVPDISLLKTSILCIGNRIKG
jgi:hypothetical protein